MFAKQVQQMTVLRLPSNARGANVVSLVKGIALCIALVSSVLLAVYSGTQENARVSARYIGRLLLFSAFDCVVRSTFWSSRRFHVVTDTCTHTTTCQRMHP